MRIQSGFLGTRVGRRTLLHFLGAALLPVLVSSTVGIWYVRQSLEAESIERVQRTAKSVVSIVLRDLFEAKAATATAGPAQRVLIAQPSINDQEAAHLRADGVLLRLVPHPTTTSADPDFHFLRRLEDGQIAAVHWPSQRLWSALDELVDAERTSLCVFEQRAWRRVHCNRAVSAQTEAALREVASSDIDSDSRSRDGALLVARRNMYLRFELGAAEWRLVAAEHRDAAVAPAAAVTSSLLLLMALAMVSAFAFAHRQIRRSTEPLSALSDATRRVADGDLETPVRIDTEDEYGELGRAFNGMTSALSRQLQLLHRMDDVDEATLRERRVDAIARTALGGLQDAPFCRRVGVAIIDEHDTSTMTQWWFEPETATHTRDTVAAPDLYRRQLLAHPRQFVRGAESTGASKDSTGHPLPTAEICYVFPLFHDEELLGAATLELSPEATDRTEIALASRRLADRVALGVANVRLLTRLDALSTGTLLAFARAIDANSPWTAGHSERVTHLALRLGQQLSLSRSDLSTLYRGGLMHDIGKIGIPPEVLDKPSRLSDAERLVIERHPEIGERILKPIPAFVDALPIVRSHHERIDGTGYPDQLAGENIPWLARILAVADVFDALVSDRPYRAGLSPRAAVTMIEAQSGSHFDARVVDALRAIERQSDDFAASATMLPGESPMRFSSHEIVNEADGRAPVTSRETRQLAGGGTR